jgi:serine/threonine protein kinase
MTSVTLHSLVATQCLTEDEVVSFAAGQLSAEKRQEAHLHLDACEVCQHLLNEAVHGLATAATATDRSPEDDAAWSTLFRPGTIVGGRYLIRRFVARGGMGEVYEAFDRELQERVALKTVTSTASDDPNAVRRLKAEVQLARRVSHPNVCRIYDFGTHASSTNGPQLAFLTMEFVDGETLGRHLRLEGALSLDEALPLARQLLLGLAAAHDAGVLHRDFKSDNVILRRDGQRKWPLILDFGLARTLDPFRSQSSASQRGLVGTFAYIAPEQLEGKPSSTASDVYSLGVVLFEMLTGELPFKARSAKAIPTLDRLLRPAPAPSSVNPAVPAFLDELVLGCLRRSPEERFQSAADVLRRLDELERRPARNKPRLAAWAAGAVAIAACIAYLVLLASPRAPTAAAPAPRELIPAAPAVAPPAPPRASLPSALPSVPPAPPSVRQASEAAPTTTQKESAARRALPAPPPQTSSPVPPPAPVLSSSTPTPTAPSPAVAGWENPFQQDNSR